jgi:hypothetical protein
MLFEFSCQDAPQRQTGQSISLLHQGRLVVINVKRIEEGGLATMCVCVCRAKDKIYLYKKH